MRLKHFKGEAVLSNAGGAERKADCSRLPGKEEDGKQHLDVPPHTAEHPEYSQPLKNWIQHFKHI